VIAELLKEKGVTPELPAEVDYVVAAFNSDFMGPALQVARSLRLAGKSVDVYTEPSRKVAKAYNYADRVGARRVALVAPSEWEKGCVRVKDLRSFSKDASSQEKERDIPVSDLANADAYFGTSVPIAPSVPIAASVPIVASAPVVASEESLLADQPYLMGFTPSKKDREKFEELARTTGKPQTSACQRWYEHIQSFSDAERARWS